MKREMFRILTSEWFNNLISKKYLSSIGWSLNLHLIIGKWSLIMPCYVSYPGFFIRMYYYKEDNKKRTISIKYNIFCTLCRKSCFRLYIDHKRPRNRYCNKWYIFVDQVGSKLQILKNVLALLTCITLSVKIDKQGNVLICKSLLTSIYSTSFS